MNNIACCHIPWPCIPVCPCPTPRDRIREIDQEIARLYRERRDWERQDAAQRLPAPIWILPPPHWPPTSAPISIGDVLGALPKSQHR